MSFTPEEEAELRILLGITNKTVSDLELAPTLAGDMLMEVESGSGTFSVAIDNLKTFIAPPATTTTRGVVFRKSPTVQKFTSGSGTYTTSSGALYLKVRMSAGGGGGGGSGLTGGTGGNGGNSTFGTSLLTTTGGVGGVFNAQGSSGGTATVSSPAISILDVAGSNGGTAEQARTFAYGGSGGSNPISAVAPMSNATAGLSGKLGGGGAGGSGGGAAIITGSGGGAGAYIEAIISSPSATYSYAVGSGGAGGTAGTSGFAGGAGGNGFIEITEYYN